MDQYGDDDFREFYYGEEDESESEEGEDEIVYAENGNREADGSLQWTTATYGDFLDDDEATQNASGSMSQISQSRLSPMPFPSLVTRRERRRLRRQMMERKNASKNDDEDPNVGEFESNREVTSFNSDDEDGDDVLASIQASIDRTGTKDATQFKRSSCDSGTCQEDISCDGANTYTMSPIDAASLNSEGEANVRSDPTYSSKHDERADSINHERNGALIEKRRCDNDFEKKKVTQVDLFVSNESIHGSGTRLHTDEGKTASLVQTEPVMPTSPDFSVSSHGDFAAHSVTGNHCAMGMPENLVGSSIARVPWDSRGRLESVGPLSSAKTKKLRIANAPVNKIQPFDGRESAEKIIQKAKRRHRTKHEYRQNHQDDCIRSVSFHENQEGFLLAIRNERRRHQPRTREKKVDRVNVQSSSSCSSVPGASEIQVEHPETEDKWSIVACRPSHWNRSRKFTASHRTSFCGNKPDTPRAAALSRATMTRILTPTSRSDGNGNKQKAKARTSPKNAHPAMKEREEDVSCSASKSFVPCMSQLSHHSVSNSKLIKRGAKWEQNADVRNAGFAPSFFSRPKGLVAAALISEDAGNMSQLGDAATNIDSEVTPTKTIRAPVVTAEGTAHLRSESKFGSSIARSTRTSSTRKRKRAGALVLRWRKIRNNIEGEDVRLQSGAYPFKTSKCTFELNDPRGRAKSFADVTLLGELFPWDSGRSYSTVLGYVHSMTRKNGPEPTFKARLPIMGMSANTRMSAGHAGAVVFSALENETNRDCFVPSFPGFVWICFTKDTALSKRLGCGVQLRVYDSTVVCSSNASNFIPTMVCTRICELYPKELPSLPSPPLFAK